jgi:hypothetical protein
MFENADCIQPTHHFIPATMRNKIWVFGLLLAWAVACLSGCASKRSTGEVEVHPAPRPGGPVVHSFHTNHWTEEWTPLFNGRTLQNWMTTDFAGGNEAKVEKGAIQIESGAELSGITWTNGSLPKTNYEIELDAIKVQGGDFFCGLTFPVRNSFCSLIMGGWGGSVVGLSSLDGLDASENETTKSLYIVPGKWYHVRVRVTDKKIQVWLDQDPIIDVSIEDRNVDIRFGEIFRSKPLGIATWQTSSALKNIQLRLINP